MAVMKLTQRHNLKEGFRIVKAANPRLSMKSEKGSTLLENHFCLLSGADVPWGMAEIPEVWAEWTGASWGRERVSLSSLGRVTVKALKLNQCGYD